MRRWVRAALGLFVVAVACSGEGARTFSVEAGEDRVFSPQQVTVPVGTTLTWRVEGSQPHTVTAYEDELPSGGGFFASGGSVSERAARAAVTEGLLEDGDTYSARFTQPGTYRYFCIPHEAAGMTGIVVVER